MVWDAFYPHGKSELTILKGTQRSENYIETLEDYLLPFFDRFPKEKFIFQQDNASVHISKKTKKWFEEQKIEVLEWPALSPDLNPIENIYGILARRDYANERQFNTRNELIAIIQKTWNEIEPEFLSRLVGSMKNRCASAVEKKGDKISY